MISKINIIRENSSLLRVSNNEDRISGLFLTTVDFADTYSLLSESFDAGSYGVFYAPVELAAEDDTIGKIVNKFFETNPSGVLYVAYKNAAPTIEDIIAFQQATEGKMRQIAVWKATETALCGAVPLLEEAYMPALFITNKDIPATAATTAISPNSAGVVSFVGRGEFVSGIPVLNDALSLAELLGHISKAAVHESIGWVAQHKTTVPAAYFNDGTAVSIKSLNWMETVSANGYLFYRYYTGISGVYYSDSNCTKSGDTIESYRTMNKACRGIYASLVPELGRPLYVDAETGKLSEDTCAYLETVAQRTLDDMEKAGELSGWKVEIDREQNVLETSTVEFVVKQVPVGVMRIINLRISFATSV